MKIAQLAPVVRAISPKNKYGGIEAIVTSLCNLAADAGHEVVLYAPYGSDIKHPNLTIRWVNNLEVEGHPEKIRESELDLFKRIVAEQDEFDIIHTHIEPIIARRDDGNYYADVVKPMVVTMHNQTYIDEHVAYYKEHKEVHGINYAFISHNQAKPLSFLPNQSVVYNGIDISKITFSDSAQGDQAVFIGRVTPEKGIKEAIEIAMKAGWKLVAGAAIDPSQREYYENEIKPLLDGKQIRYLGEISNEEKNEMLGGSAALLFPIRWQEPFGLVMVEAMAAGTPVVAPNIGSVKEVVKDGETGFVVPEESLIEEGALALGRVGEISREKCRRHTEENFSHEVMVKNYLKLYEQILEDRHV